MIIYTQNPGFSAYTQHRVLYTWDELNMLKSDPQPKCAEEVWFFSDFKTMYMYYP